MDNPCFQQESGPGTDSGGEWGPRRLPPPAPRAYHACIRRCYPGLTPPCTIQAYQPAKLSTIYDPRRLSGSDGGGAKLRKAWLTGGWRLELVEDGESGKERAVTAICVLLLASFVTLAATTLVVCFLRTTAYNPTKVLQRGPWFGVLVVDGEFRVTNVPFRLSLTQASSRDFALLGDQISRQLDMLFAGSEVADLYNASEVTGFAPDLMVRCQLTLTAPGQLNISSLGLAFLNGLNHRHGALWLGNFTVDVQSIGFEGIIEEVKWSNWSEWGNCYDLSNGTSLCNRTRFCLLHSGLHLSRVEPCLALPGKLSHIEYSDCQLDVTLADERQGDLAVQTTRPTFFVNTDIHNVSGDDSDISYHSTALQRTGMAMLDVVEDDGMNDTQSKLDIMSSVSDKNSTSNDLSDMSRGEGSRRCDVCQRDEVCVALQGELAPWCHRHIDIDDPTGCGGLCKMTVEICQRLQKGVYRCMDDSKCLKDEWQCGNQLCIPQVKRCDGHFNCYDHTDEYGCPCNLKSHFRCGNKTSCLPIAKRCDGIVDCWDAADEINCTTACLDSMQFTCNDSQCIPNKQFCDGFADCYDHSDEPFGCGGECKSHEWKCRNGRCIGRKSFCDGLDDCGDQSDEIQCPVR